MGFQKRLLEDAEVGGLSLAHVLGRHVCRRCVPDAGLKSFAKSSAKKRATCTYCGRSGAATLGEVIKFMDRRIATEFDIPENGLGRDSESPTGWDGEVFSTAELLLDELSLDFEDPPQLELRGDILEALGDRQWCVQDPYGPRPHERIGATWALFSTILMHERRFFFMQFKGASVSRRLMRDEAAYDLPGWLEALGGYAVRTGLVRTLPKGSQTLRVQYKGKGSTPPFDAARMGPPPRRRAEQSNRMSPPGVPMFYGAVDRKTALLETVDKAGTYAIGEFKTVKDIQVLDLTRVFSTPSIFDEAASADRRWAMFMHRFLSDFSRPIRRDERVHVDYVPTQAVTEYFRTSVRSKGRPIKGVVYRSARKGGKVCHVLFADQSSVVGTPAATRRVRGKPWLKMVGYSEVKRSSSKMP